MYFRTRMEVSWKYTFFIARRLQQQQTDGKQVSKPIVRIATWSIAVAMIVNISTIAVVKGFQQEVKDKVAGFGAHLTALKIGEQNLMESTPILQNTFLEKTLLSTKGIQHIQPVAYKPVLFQSVDKSVQREILGGVFKGVDANYDWSFLKKHLVAGRLPKIGAKKLTDEVLLSEQMCAALHYKLGDTIAAYFVKQQPILRTFKLVGIYTTGLEDVDKQMAICELGHVQQFNDWGIQAEIEIDDTLSPSGLLIVRARVNGGNGNYRFDWGKGFEKYGGFSFCPTKDTTIRLIVGDYWSHMDEPFGVAIDEGETALPDTAYLSIKRKGAQSCLYQMTDENTLSKKYADNTGLNYSIPTQNGQIVVQSRPGNGSWKNYIGAYELTISNWDELDKVHEATQRKVLFQPEFNQQVSVKSIKEQHQELFVWLGFLDLNMGIVLLLMLLIGIINMGSAFLVMIVVKTNFIGIFKSIGATNKLIRRVFIVQAGRLILKGMFWGNAIGILICGSQAIFKWMPLDPKVYYLDAVPMQLNVFILIGLNILTLLICLMALLLPALVIARIVPAKTIRFK